MIKKQFNSGPSYAGWYKYDMIISEGTTLKDFVKFVLNEDIYECGCIYVTCKDPSLDSEYLAESEKLKTIMIEYKDKSVIKEISDVYLYNENQDMEIDVDSESVARTYLSIGDYEIKLKSI